MNELNEPQVIHRNVIYDPEFVDSFYRLHVLESDIKTRIDDVNEAFSNTSLDVNLELVATMPYKFLQNDVPADSLSFAFRGKDNIKAG